MNALSPWAVSTGNMFATDPSALYQTTVGNVIFKIYHLANELVVCADFSESGKLVFRAAYSPQDKIQIERTEEHNDGVDFNLSSGIGKLNVKIRFINNDYPILRYTTSLIPAADLLIPYWPREIISVGKNGKPENTTGKIHVSQVGTRSGMMYFSQTKPKGGSVLYLQNLTALADYCQQTETSCGDTVGGDWPEIGFALPPAKKPLAAGKEVITSDAFVVFDPLTPANENDMVMQYLDMLAAAYLQVPRPDTQYQHWPAILDKGLKDLIQSPACWTHYAGHDYLNAYVSDYDTPPEIMVQLAVLLPLDDYTTWNKSNLDVIKKVRDNLESFYDKKLGTIMRWLPAAEDDLEEEEEQKKPLVMDSWYLHHPLLNLSRLALKGDELAKKLFLDSLEFAIKVAHHFNYQWPVFYKMDTLEVIKAETQPGKGGEKDVPGLYAHVMLQAWELTGKKRYLQEAEKAAKKLKGLGFDLFYQANNTSFSAGALLRLYKITGNKLYLELSYLCLANVFKNVRLWDCNYGYGKNFPSFFALFPLNDAPYTAVYEEQEVFCALHDYLMNAEGVDIQPSVTILASEYIRYLVDRAVYYYPPMLPKEMLSPDVKIGEVDPKLWIALEDMHDGWEQCGQVGQEVYGAGNAFGILPRHYMQVPGENFMVYVDYPTNGFKARKGSNINFKIVGDNRLTCRMMIVKTNEHKLPKFAITIKGQKQELQGKTTNDGHLEFQLSGNTEVKISWKK